MLFAFGIGLRSPIVLLGLGVLVLIGAIVSIIAVIVNAIKKK